ncbi:uncharacterized protein THITE_2126199 [Thermothielavioides terrestris NRRL 8126]|uniref:Uncharacterized protein n=1 Tax=Thermothielavioides terrestris (strain ATCC 38088 / NRRL 8126) TaxID=578455 RepID=G2QUU5_THETT|nr:uncharacterized protein THITE_2126199 [Thermothielavioides terrestris NRRL 8126]AEO63740.1 hypothetical protein THITE_2126199 [Thermothielavioides terrestris NRRL 8126]
MWLPPRDGLETHAELPEGCYDHPVVILSPQASPPDDYVVVLIVTSFDETDIRDRFPRDRDAALRRAYLPIHPASNPDVETVLHLADGAELSKKSYVNTRKKHTVPLRIIRPYVGHGPAAAEQYILTRESYLALARHARFDTYLPATVREPGPLLAELPPAERLGLEPPVSHGTMAVAKAPTPPLSPILRDTSPYTTPALRSYPPAERLGPAPPISYGTIPVARAAPPPPLPHLTRDDFLRTTTTPALRPYHYPSRQSQHDATPLPRFHYSQPTARYRAGATLWPDGSGLPSGRVGPLLPFPRKLLLYAIVVCLYCGGLWAGWAYRAEIGAALLAGVRMEMLGRHSDSFPECALEARKGDQDLATV